MTSPRSIARVGLAALVIAGSAAFLAGLPAAAERAASGAQTRVASPCDTTTNGRVVAVGDVHGAFDQYVSILTEARVIDSRRRWIGGNAVLVQVGDVVDRGPHSRQALDLIRKLEGEAAKAGGAVIFLLGNHEFMRMGGHYTDVSPEEYKAFESADAVNLRERLYDHLLNDRSTKARASGENFDPRVFRKEFLASIPLGSVEMQIAFSEKGDYGPWLREHDVMARVNGVAFVHAGPGPAMAQAGCAGTNARARAELRTVQVGDPKSFLWSPDGPLWFRGLVGVDPASTAEDVTAVLKSLDVSHIVVGHSVSASGRIRAHHDGRVFQIDTGMLGGQIYPGGVPSALEIEDGRFTAIYQGRRELVFSK